jgi:hypothetical protein
LRPSFGPSFLSWGALTKLGGKQTFYRFRVSDAATSAAGSSYDRLSMRMIKTAALLALIAVAAVALLANASVKVTCADWPVLSVNPRASRPLGRATARASCRVQMRNGLPLPDPKCTPGAINPTVTRAVLQDNSFRTG